MNDHLKQHMREHHERKSRAHEALAQLDWQLAQGEITRNEYDFHMFRLFGEQPHKTIKQLEMHSRALHNTKHIGGPRTVEVVLLAVIMIGLMGLILFLGSGATGLLVFEEQEQAVGLTFTGNGEYAFNTTNTTTLKVTGTLSGGAANLRARINGAYYAVLDKDSATLTGVWVDKSNYSLASQIDISVLPTDASYTLWLTAAGGEKNPVSEPLNISEPGEYLLEAIINASGEIVKKSTRFVVRNDSDFLLDVSAEKPLLTFTDTCTETCTLSGASEITLVADVSEGAELVIETITINRARENGAPVQIADIPNIAVDTSSTLDLSAYFADPDGDNLIYDINNIIGVEESISGNTLTLTSNVPGTYMATIYASDLDALTQSNEFTITVLDSATADEEIISEENNTEIIPEENTTTNTTIENNQTINETIVATNTTEIIITEPIVTDCNNPNVNLRPAECFSDVLDDAFLDIVAPLENKDQSMVGRFTRFGSLVIRGLVKEGSAEQPGSRDFQIGVTTRNDFSNTFTATAWIDTTTGDLHLKGRLYQEEGVLQAPQYNSYIISNNNGIVLGYFNENTGDLHLKGNIVQLGKV